MQAVPDYNGIIDMGISTDLRVNLPIHPGQDTLIREILASVAHCDLPATSLADLLKTWFSRDLLRGSHVVPPPRIILGKSAKDLIAVSLSALSYRGDAIAVDIATYPRIKKFADDLNLRCIAIGSDSDGLSCSELADAASRYSIAALYVQPTIHNPLGITMSIQRRHAIASVLERHDIFAIEDTVFAFLHYRSMPLLAACAPSRTIVIDSLSKKISAALNLGFAAFPDDALTKTVNEKMHYGPIIESEKLALVFHLVTSHRWQDLIKLKRNDARSRNKLARQLLPRECVVGNNGAYHLWLSCSSASHFTALAALASKCGVEVSSWEEFAVDYDRAPYGARIALGSLPYPDLHHALQVLGGIWERRHLDIATRTIPPHNRDPAH